MAYLNKVELQDYLSKLFAQCTVKASLEQIEKLATLLQLLKTWSKALNLTAITDIEDMAVLHVMDSAVAVPLLGKAQRIADIGTGAGFPGLVLAILCPDKEFTLIDAVAKKLSFVRTAAVQLGLTNVTIVHTRVEDFHPDPLFDLAVNRAFAPLERMSNWCLPLIAPHGHLLALKAHLSKEEMQALPPTVKIDKIETLQVPALDAVRQAVVLSRV